MDKRLYIYGSAYGVVICFLSLGAMLAFDGSMHYSKIIFFPLFLPFMVAGIATGILNLKLVKIMASSALAQNQPSKNDAKPEN